MIFRTFILFSVTTLSATLAGCSTIGIDSKNPPLYSELALKETKDCKTTSKKKLYPDGKEWNMCTRDAALISYEYAQMSANVYAHEGAKSPFNLGENLKPLETLVSDKSTGLQYRVFGRYKNGEITEVIISFRGTNFTAWQDWAHGNIGLTQRAQALEAFDRVYKQYDTKVSVTGHSLGGALATQVSLCRDVHYNIVFDTSSRFSKRFCGVSYINHNISIVEFGEINKVLRLLGFEPDQRYVSLNCLDKGNALGQHNMEKLAACLTNIAALDDNTAQESKVRNDIPNNPNDWK